MQLGILCRYDTKGFVKSKPMGSFGERVREAREHAGLSQAELASQIGVKQQAIEYLENPKNNAQASRHTSEIARICDVDAGWLAKGKGRGPKDGAAEPGSAQYGALSAEALEVARLWSDLSPQVRAWVRDLIYLTRLGERRYPWLRRGRPQGESYDDWEKRMEQNFKATIALEMGRGKGGK
jgi:transcriptional regulator with XRE-family HTH domain